MFSGFKYQALVANVTVKWTDHFQIRFVIGKVGHKSVEAFDLSRREKRVRYGFKANEWEYFVERLFAFLLLIKFAGDDISDWT